jgi:hypothetical protein
VRGYEQFCDLVLAKDPKSYTRSVLNSQQYRTLSPETLTRLKRLIKAHLRFELALQYTRLCFQKQIVSDSWPSAEAVFQTIDKRKKGWISVHDLEQLMEGSSASANDLL